MGISARLCTSAEIARNWARRICRVSPRWVATNRAATAGQAKFDQNRAPGFQPRQIQPFERLHLDALAQQHRIAVPAEADIVHRNLDRFQIGATFDLVAVKSGRAVAKPAVCLLQRNDVGLQRRDHVESAPRAAATVQTDTFADVVRGDPKRACVLFHTFDIRRNRAK